MNYPKAVIRDRKVMFQGTFYTHRLLELYEGECVTVIPYENDSLIVVIPDGPIVRASKVGSLQDNRQKSQEQNLQSERKKSFENPVERRMLLRSLVRSASPDGRLSSQNQRLSGTERKLPAGASAGAFATSLPFGGLQEGKGIQGQAQGSDLPTCRLQFHLSLLLLSQAFSLLQSLLPLLESRSKGQPSSESIQTKGGLQ